MRIMNKQNLIPPGTVLNTTVNSQPISLETLFTFAVQIFFNSGTVNGTFVLEASCDPFPNGSPVSVGGVPTNVVTNWTVINQSSEAEMAAGNILWNYNGFVGFNYVRVNFTDASGGTSTGTVLSCTFNGKG